MRGCPQGGLSTLYQNKDLLLLKAFSPARGAFPGARERVAEGRMRGKPFNRPWCFPKVSGYQQRGLSDPGSQGEEKKTLPHTNNSPNSKYNEPTLILPAQINTWASHQWFYHFLSLSSLIYLSLDTNTLAHFQGNCILFVEQAENSHPQALYLMIFKLFVIS